jgi:hypothetical protein
LKKTVVLDYKPVCQVANEYIQQFNLQDRIQTRESDFFNDQMSNVTWHFCLMLYTFLIETNIILLKKIHYSLPSEKGMIVISEWSINDEKIGPVPSVLNEPYNENRK